MKNQILKEQVEMMICREYADLPKELRIKMIESEWKSIDERAKLAAKRTK